MPVSKPFAPGALAAALLFASTNAHAQTPPCDAVCAAHEAAVAGALPRHPDRAARHAALRALQAEPNRAGEWPDAQVRLNIEQLEIPMHMEPTVMLMVEQPLPNRRARSAGVAALMGAQQAEVARIAVADARTAWELRKALISWQQAAERQQVIAFHLELLSGLERVAARLPATAGGPGRWLTLQAERAELALLAEEAALETARLETQLTAQGVKVPAQPTRAQALEPLPAPPSALALPDEASEVQARWLDAENAALDARIASIQAEQAPIWSPGIGVMRMEGMPIAWMASLGLRWPEAPWLAKRNQRRLAHVVPQRQRLAAERTRQRAAQVRAADDVLARWRSAQLRQHTLIDQLIPLASKRVAAQQPLLQTGQVSAFELTNTLHAQLQYEQRMVDARAAWRLARAEWLAVVAGASSQTDSGGGAMAPVTSNGADSGMAGH